MQWLIYVNEVHSSNISKVCRNIEIRDSTVQYYKTQNIDVYFKEIELDNQKMYIIYRLSDNKVLKSIEYTKPNLTQFF
jgi:hypothetical protein